MTCGDSALGTSSLKMGSLGMGMELDPQKLVKGKAGAWALPISQLWFCSHVDIAPQRLAFGEAAAVCGSQVYSLQDVAGAACEQMLPC